MPHCKQWNGKAARCLDLQIVSTFKSEHGNKARPENRKVSGCREERSFDNLRPFFQRASVHFMLTLKTSSRITARIPASLLFPILFSHPSKSGSSHSTTRPVQNNLMIRGLVSKEQNIIVTLPFSRM